MSDASFDRILDRALLRARALALLEAIVCGAGAAAVSPVAAVLVAGLVAVLRLRHWTRTAVVGALERATPASRNVLVAADEIRRGRLAAGERARARVFADAAKIAGAANVSRAIPLRPLMTCAAASVLIWVTALAIHRVDTTPAKRPGAAGAARARDGAAAMTIAVVVRSPSYTGIPESHLIDPTEVRGVEGSVAILTIAAGGPVSNVTLEHDGVTRTLAADASGRFMDRIALTKTGYVSVSSEAGPRRTLPVVVSADALPAVRITAPGRDRVFQDGAAPVDFHAQATDDYGVTSLALRYTKVSGSGEEYQFTEGEIPLAITRANARDWSGAATRTISALGLQEGDMLVYRAVATDARGSAGTAESDAYFIEISRLGIAAGDAFTLPEQETRYALSQQMLIVKTDRLAKQRAAMAADAFSEASINLAVEQRMIRAEFVFMLGGEIEDEEVEAEQSVELQSGRLANRGQRDLRAATIAMSQAEKLLTAMNPADALVAERDAVAALQRAFARDRYILRASPTRVDLDPRRRLSGDLSTAASWMRAIPETPENRRTARLQDLLKGLSELAATPDRARALVLAEMAMRIDAGSPSLREASTALQDGRVEAAVAAVAAEAARAMERPPIPVTDVAPGLRRALMERKK